MYIVGSSFGLTQIRHKLVQYPVLLEGWILDEFVPYLGESEGRANYIHQTRPISSAIRGLPIQ